MRITLRLLLARSDAVGLPDGVADIIVEYGDWYGANEVLFMTLLDAQGILRQTKGSLSTGYVELHLSTLTPTLAWACDVGPDVITVFSAAKETGGVAQGPRPLGRRIRFTVRSMWDFVCGPDTGYEFSESARARFEQFIEKDPENNLPTGGRMESRFRKTGVTPERMLWLRAEFRRVLADYSVRKECAATALARFASP